MPNWLATHPIVQHWLVGAGVAALVLLVVGVFMRGMEDFGEGEQPKTIGKQILFTMGLGLVAAVPIAVMFACTWLIQRLIDRLGLSFNGEFTVAFALSLFLVLGGFYYHITRSNEK